MKIIYKLPVFILILIPTLLSAQQKLWSLEECIKYAWDNNLKIKQQELVVETSDNNLLQSKLNYVPSVSASLSHSMNWGKSVNMNDLQIIDNQLSQSTNASARASINLFEGMAKTNDLKSKQVIREISVQEVSRIKNDISIEIAKSYLQVLLSKEILNTAKSSLASIDEQVARTKKLVDAGSDAYSSLLEVQALRATEKLQLTNAENQVSSYLLSLKQLLDLSSDSSFDISLPNLDNFVSDFKGVSIDELYSGSLDLPQIKSIRLSRDNSNIQLAIAKGRSYPTVSFTAAYGSYFSDSKDAAFMTQFNENRNPSLSFGLSIPIFDSWRTNTAIRNARIEVKKSDINVKSQEQLLYKEIQQAANDAQSYFARFKAAEENVKAMQESFRYVQQKFEVGALNATDYTVAKANLFKSQSEFYQAKYQYIFQLKILDFYKGNPITL